MTPNCICRGGFALEIRPKFPVNRDPIRQVDFGAVEQIEDLPPQLDACDATDALILLKARVHCRRAAPQCLWTVPARDSPALAVSEIDLTELG